MKNNLTISECGHFLEYKDGSPFFYLGDTAWELFHRLNREEADIYLEDRKKKGFTVIQAVVLSEIDGLEVPNPYGDLPLVDLDLTKPNEKYFEHVDYIINKADELDLFIGLLPTWGKYWSSSAFVDVTLNRNVFTAASAEVYGEYLGARYKDKPIIWILGGDRDINTDSEREIIQKLAMGIKKGDEGTHLMTYHPMGPGRSAEQCPEANWLDFNMYQSSHGSRNHDNGIYASADYHLTPVKPTVDGEPRYEGIPVGFYYEHGSNINRFDDFDCRQAAYNSILAGACGHTYGNNNIWQMWTPERKPVIHANIPWYEALNHQGSWQMGYVRRLFESKSFYKLVPDNGDLVVDGPKSGEAKIRAGLAKDGSFAMIYSPYGKSFTINRQYIKGNIIKETWYDPRYGVFYHSKTTGTKAFQTYDPPTSGRGCDWILVLEESIDS